MSRLLYRVGCCAIAALVAAPASAEIIQFTGDIGNSTEQTGASYAGSIEYEHLGGLNGLLTITITNTTDPAIGGFLTGFLFNIGSTDAGAEATLDSATNPNFVGLQNVSGSPFGTFDAGAAVSGNFEGGGSPSGGIAVSDTGVFTFLVTASDAGALSPMNFLGTANEFGFIVRLRGVGDGGEGSDKIPAKVVPAPGALALLAMAGLVGSRRRRSPGC